MIPLIYIEQITTNQTVTNTLNISNIFSGMATILILVGLSAVAVIVAHRIYTTMFMLDNMNIQEIGEVDENKSSKYELYK